MNETLQNKINRIISGDDGIYRIDVSYKCKTKDGILCTMEQDEFSKRDDENTETFAFRIINTATETMLHFSDDAEIEGFMYSASEMVSIKRSEITRMWAELGDIYTNSMPKEA